MSEPEQYMKDMWNFGIHAYSAINDTINCRLIPYQTQQFLVKQTKRWYSALQNCTLIGDIHLYNDEDFNSDDCTENSVIVEEECKTDDDTESAKDNFDKSELEAKNEPFDKLDNNEDWHIKDATTENDDEILGSFQSHKQLMDEMFPGTTQSTDWYEMTISQASYIKAKRQEGKIYTFDFVPAGLYEDPYYKPSLKFFNPENTPYLI